MITARSLVWLTGSLCSASRLPLSVILTMWRLRKPDLAVLALGLAAAFATYLLLRFVQIPLSATSGDRHWLINLMVNFLGYGTIFFPGYLIIRYVRSTNYVELGSGSVCMESLVRLCVHGSEETLVDSLDETKSSASPSTLPNSSPLKDALRLGFCFAGLQVSYLTWGVLQEKIMTQTYVDSIRTVGRFRDSQFLVFVNRILAFAIALLYITLSSSQPRHKAPIFKYSFCSLSNILSSWCQYEALKFISFPTQVLAKASKIIPVMIMGKIVSKKKYEFYEYVIAIMISLGMMLFLFGSSEDNRNTTVTTTSGVILLVGYMASDAFTSNWQGELFTTYKMSSVQMMCGVNLFSCLLTASSLVQQGAFYESLVFMSQYPKFTFDCVVLSICSAIGQLFIYHTINTFGPVVFVIIMTLRQAMAILLSCIIYSHPLTFIGILGVTMVFSAMFMKIYCSHRLKQLRRQQAISSSNAVNIKI